MTIALAAAAFVCVIVAIACWIANDRNQQVKHFVLATVNVEHEHYADDREGFKTALVEDLTKGCSCQAVLKGVSRVDTDMAVSFLIDGNSVGPEVMTNLSSWHKKVCCVKEVRIRTLLIEPYTDHTHDPSQITRLTRRPPSTPIPTSKPLLKPTMAPLAPVVVTPCSAGMFRDGTDCHPWTVCSANEFEVAAPTETADRECQTVTDCLAVDAYEIVAPTTTSDRVCRPSTKCRTDQFEFTPLTRQNDRVCSACPADQYLQNGTCKNQRNCEGNEYEVVPPTPSSDRVCALR